jgi:hypothetical protein
MLNASSLASHKLNITSACANAEIADAVTLALAAENIWRKRNESQEGETIIHEMRRISILGVWFSQNISPCRICEAGFCASGAGFSGGILKSATKN